MLTRKEGGGAARVFPLAIDYSALVEPAPASTGAVSDDCTIHFGWKPTAATSAPLNDMTGHYLLTIRYTGGVVTVWKQGTQLAAYGGSVGATYAEFVRNVLTYYSGSHAGYFSRLILVDGNADYTYADFIEPSDQVTGLWIPMAFQPEAFDIVSNDQAFADGTATASSYVSGYPPENAFDGSSATSYNPNAINECTLTYDFGEGGGKRIVAYDLYATDGYENSANTPILCYLHGSSDGEAWTQLDYWSETGWGDSISREYTIAMAYRFYRWTLAASANYVATVGEIVGYEAVETYYGENGCRLDFADADNLGADSVYENRAAYSEDLSGDYWTKVGVTVDGTLVAADGVTDYPSVYQQYETGLNREVTFEADLWPGSTSVVHIGDGYQTGALSDFTLTGDGSYILYNASAASITRLDNGRYRCRVTFTTGGTYTYVRMHMSPNGYTELANADSFNADRMQIKFNADAAYKETVGTTLYTGWTVTGEQTLDTPTNNHAVFDALRPANDLNLSNGNRSLEQSVGGWNTAVSTLGLKSGKYYAEFAATNAPASNVLLMGIVKNGTDISSAYYIGQDATSWGISFGADGSVYVWNNGAGAIGGVFETLDADDVLQVAVDMDNGYAWFGINDTWIQGDPSQGAAPSVTGVPEDMLIGVSGYAQYAAGPVNFGATGFAHTPPTGFKSICADNLPRPTILRSSRVADIVLRDGTGVAAGVTSLEFQPDLVNSKNRSAGYHWMGIDSARGDYNLLYTSSDAAQDYATNYLETLVPNGYTFGDSDAVNGVGSSFVELCLKAGTDQGFQIKTFTHVVGTDSVLSHDLGKAVTFALIKQIDGTWVWNAFHAALGGDYFLIPSGIGTAGSSPGIFATTATTFTLAGSSFASGQYVAYLFTDSDVFRAFSYVGNGSTDGPVLNLGAKPLAIPFGKNTAASLSWFNYDAVRDPSNPLDGMLYPDLPNAEYSPYEALRFTGNGCKVITDGGQFNGSGHLIIGLAILEAATNYTNAF